MNKNINDVTLQKNYQELSIEKKKGLTIGTKGTPKLPSKLD
jgi:hypothetical protein